VGILEGTRSGFALDMAPREWALTAPSTSAANDLVSTLTGIGIKLAVRDRGSGLGVLSLLGLSMAFSLLGGVIGSFGAPLKRSGDLDSRAGEC
jgi:hypothetical protein